MNEHVDRRRVAVRVAVGALGLTVSLAGDEVLRYLLLVSASSGHLLVPVGVLGFAIALPGLLAAILGAFVDRFHRQARLVMLLSLLASTMLTLVAVAVWDFSIAGLVVCLIGFGLELLGGVVATSWQSAVPELAGTDPKTRRRFVSWTSASLAVGPAIGPTIAALLYQVISPQALLAIEAITFAVAGLAMLPAYTFLRGQRAVEPEKPRSHELRWIDTFAGIQMVWSSDLVRTPVISLSIMNIVTSLVLFGLPVSMLARGYSTIQVGVAMTVMTVGSVLSSFGGALFSKPAHFRVYLSIEPVLRAAGLLVFSVGQNLAILFVGLVLFSVPQGVGRISRQSILSAAFPAGSRGRAVGGYRFLARAFVPFAPLALSASWGAGVLGWIFVGGAIVMAIPGLLVLSDRKLSRQLRQLSGLETGEAAAQQSNEIEGKSNGKPASVA